MRLKYRYNIKNIEEHKTYIYFNPTKINPTKSNNLEDINNDLDAIKLLLIEDDDRIDVYPNNEDVNQSNNSYKDVTDYIYRIINNPEFLCKGLNPDYILKSFDNVDAVVIIGSLMNILPNGNIFGFALINFDQDHNSIYIDVICSHKYIEGAGDILMKEI